MQRISFLLIIFLTTITFSFADEWQNLKDGGKIVLIRHSLAPGGGDPDGFKIDDCKTQRNLNDVGIAQSKKIGALFKNNNIKVDTVLSSQWCRCKDTAFHAFGDYKEFSALNSTFQAPYSKNEPQQLRQIKEYVKNWESDKNLILVTHYSIITSITNAVPSSGEIVVTDKSFKVLNTIETLN